MAVVATGFFYGVHLGHRKVIEALIREARTRSEQSLVLTFWPHPRTVLQDDARSLRLLTSLEEKTAILKDIGVDEVEVLPFTRDFASMTSEAYLRDIVRDRFSGTAIVLGYDNRIGSDGACADDMAPCAERLGLDVVKCAPLGDISSTRIRNSIASGKVSEAAEMMGRPYCVKGVVVGGHKVGRTIGYPTANMRFYEPLKILPASGAYLTKVRTLEEEYYGMTNVASDGKVETHILGFNEEIYGLDIRIEFLRFLRDERKFQGVDELKKQLDIDMLSCKNIIFGL